MLKLLKTRKGQSTLEYLVLVAMVIAILIIFLNPTTGIFGRAYNNTLQQGTQGMTDMANRLSMSRPTSS
jgi:uncharacterized protein (UPF0333 family)